MTRTAALSRPATSSTESLNGDRSGSKALAVGHSTRSIKAFPELLVGHPDYMQTRAFATILANVIDPARTDRVALMCAEAVPRRCHRSLIADALLLTEVPGRAIEVLGSSFTLDRMGVRRWTCAPLLASSQRFSRVDDDRWLTRVIVVLCDRVHSAVGVGAFLVHALHGAVANCAAVMPSHFRTQWNCLKRNLLYCSHRHSHVG